MKNDIKFLEVLENFERPIPPSLDIFNIAPLRPCHEACAPNHILL